MKIKKELLNKEDILKALDNVKDKYIILEFNNKKLENEIKILKKQLKQEVENEKQNIT